MAKRKDLNKLFNNKTEKKALSNEDFEFIENIRDSINIDGLLPNDQKNITSNETYKIQEFLDTDHTRLQYMDHLYSKKLFILSNFSQSKSIIDSQIENLTLLKDKIKEMLLIDSSRFLKKIEYLWDDSFSNND